MMKESLGQFALRFKKDMEKLESLRVQSRRGGQGWQIQGIKANLGFDISGNVSMVSLGGEVELSLGWDFRGPHENDKSYEIFEKAGAKDSMGKLSLFMNQLQGDVGKSFKRALRRNRRRDSPLFIPTKLIIGLGGYAQGKFALAQVGGMAGLSLVFKYGDEESLDHGILDKEFENDDGEYLMENPDLYKKTFIRSHGNEKGPVKRMLRYWKKKGQNPFIRLKRKTFRRQLATGLRSSLYFVHQISGWSRSKEDHSFGKRAWTVGGLTTYLRLGMGGSIGLATVGGVQSMRLKFTRVWR